MNRPSYFNQNLNNGNEEVSTNSSNPIFSIEAKPYRCMIKHVEDNQEYNALIIYFDIVEGQLAGVFAKDSNNDFSKWNRKGKIWISYKEENSSYFEAFITAVRKSNMNFVWDWNEQKLVGKNIVIVYGEEEFQTKDTKEIKVSIKPRVVRSIEALNKGEITPLSIKRLSKQSYSNRNYQNSNYNQYYNANNNGYQNNYNQPNPQPQYQETPDYDIDIKDEDLPF